jgi:CO dehydrogenase/acetyl-CoA synthase epsilon subunit
VGGGVSGGGGVGDVVVVIGAVVFAVSNVPVLGLSHATKNNTILINRYFIYFLKRPNKC